MGVLYIDGRATFEQRGNHILATLPSGDGTVQLLLTRHAMRSLGEEARIADHLWQPANAMTARILPIRQAARS